ncbi:allantoicase [Sporobolomyces koalae]|uniref:allantoicase n=1 Tax=Sporobolomyces koalae TaxID=500713 RepID=UPI003179206A
MTTLSDPVRLPLESFDQHFGSLIELSSEALGGSIEAVSDEFFAAAACLLRVPPSVSMKGQFGPNGALFDGWESRRHNPSYDWVIVKLGAKGSIVGVDIDTGHFSGNESPASGVWGALVPEGETISQDSPLWSPLLPITPLGPAQRHLFNLPSGPSPAVTHLKLTMHPDGGIGRFRAYGHVLPSATPAPSTVTSAGLVDLGHVLNGGTVTGESDQHFGRGGNLILPGRGKDMGDGWETRRSRGRLGTGKGDWVVLKLGEPGYLEWVDIDTLHFVGNFPESAALKGIISKEECPSYDDAGWTEILSNTKLGPHRQHFYQLGEREKAWTHVRLDIFPDGGVKRLRLYGRPASQHAQGYSAAHSIASPSPVALAAAAIAAPNNQSAASSATSAVTVPKLPAVPLTPSSFAVYGSVLQSYPDARCAPKSIPIKTVNFGTAQKYNFLSPTAAPRPVPAEHAAQGVEQQLNMCVFRCEPQDAIGGEDGKWQVRVLERHEFSSQTFVPMGTASGSYLVLVALPGPAGLPDLTTLRAFLASSSQGITYHANVWHHPLIALGGKPIDFSCFVWETGVAKLDCEIWGGPEDAPVAVVELV